jgi:hypothetical protein
MKKLLIFITVFLTFQAAASEITVAGITKISSPKETLRQYELFEANLYTPADRDAKQDIAPDAEITTPSDSVITVPAFYNAKNNAWKIRYTPPGTGNYSCKFRLKGPDKNIYSESIRFKVTPSSSGGFLRKNRNNPFYLSFDSGKTFFGIGHNIGWITNNNPAGYEKYFALFKNNGCNMTRVWLNSPWTFRIEDEAVGRYNDTDSGKLDALLGLAAKYDIYLILVLDTYGSLMEEPGTWDEQCWKTNPYNKANGGPCQKPWDFFTSNEAKDYYKKRLRYIVARWSYSPNILAFELWNETDAPADWTKEMASYLKSINPHKQLVTTSLGYPWGNNFDESSIWRLPEIDIIDRHLYGGDVIDNLISVNAELSRKYNKYMVVGEFGLDSNKSDSTIDDSGKAVALHKSLWASMLTRSFATSLNWWWAEYVKAKNLYHHYRAIADFSKNIKWDSKRVDILNTSSLKCSVKNGKCNFSNVTISANDTWGEMTYKEFTVSDNGSLSGGALNAYLHGILKSDLRIEPVFNLNYAASGKFIIHVDMVSQGANLIVNLDGKDVLTKELPAGSGSGPWKRSLYRKDHDIYQCIYDIDLSIDIPEGKHTIKLSNTGPDWLRIKNITLTNYVSSDFLNASLLGLRVGNQMLFWAYNKEYIWKNAKKGIEPSLIKNASFSVQNTENGTYDMEWWDTFEGKVISRNKVTVKNGIMKLNMPSFTKDIAGKATKRGDRI